MAHITSISFYVEGSCTRPSQKPPIGGSCDSQRKLHHVAPNYFLLVAHVTVSEKTCKSGLCPSQYLPIVGSCDSQQN